MSKVLGYRESNANRPIMYLISVVLNALVYPVS